MSTLQLNQHLLLYECCQLTKGYSRSLLVDLQRNHIDFIDNEIYDILANKCRKYSTGEILDSFNEEDKATVAEYFSFLIANEYAFLCDKEEIELYPLLDLTWDHYAHINNCIIDFAELPKNKDAYKQLIRDLSQLGCEHLQIRDFCGLAFDFLEELLQLINETLIVQVELLLKNRPDYSIDTYENFLFANPRVGELIVHSSPETYIQEQNKTDQTLAFSDQELKDASCCGIVSPSYFNTTMQHYTESIQHNTCLNRKVGIDTQGNIKNCPSMPKVYGNIYQDSILDIIHKKAFSASWHIHKDQIEVCKDCEFRHICTDCRAFVQDDNQLNSKPLKCGYDPYTTQWSDWQQDKRQSLIPNKTLH